MTITSDSFRDQFPAFADESKYQDSQIDFYITLAYKLLNADRWGNVLDEGVALFVAHFMAVDALNANGGGIGGVPGTAVGVLSGGTVDKVSYTKDVNSIMEPDAGHWGMTTYGLMYLRFARMMGTGPLQIGADYSGSLSASAWQGPMLGPW